MTFARSADGGREATTVGAGLDVAGLSVDIDTADGPIRAVNEVSFRVPPGEMFALVGESGCGKSTTVHAIAGLLDPVAKVVGGTAEIDGTDVLTLDGAQRRRIAGRTLAIIFQDALIALNPVYTVGKQLAEPFRIHDRMPAREARKRALELMIRTGIPEPESRIDAYPGQFSGGMRQRLLIAMALALGPRVLLADEPTTALDVTVQAQIMALLQSSRAESQMAVVLITHDLALAAEHADRIGVMYAGCLVEEGPVDEVLANPRHPYTQGLLELASMRVSRSHRLKTIGGAPPTLHGTPKGCAFQDRCPQVQEICRSSTPEQRRIRPDHDVACHVAESGLVRHV